MTQRTHAHPFAAHPLASHHLPVMSSKCVFCRIVKKELPATIKHECDKYLVFSDHSPAGAIHLLVIPKAHMHANVTRLGATDISMVKEMETLGLDMLEASGGSRDACVTGFHWPIYTVPHLHMHVIATPIVGMWKRIEFSSLAFGTTADALRVLEQKKEKSDTS